MPKQINTVTEVLEALIDDAGSTIKLGARYGVIRSTVLMWRVRQQLPPDTYAAMTKDLARLGLKAPSGLWSQREIVT